MIHAQLFIVADQIFSTFTTYIMSIYLNGIHKSTILLKSGSVFAFLPLLSKLLKIEQSSKLGKNL